MWFKSVIWGTVNNQALLEGGLRCGFNPMISDYLWLIGITNIEKLFEHKLCMTLSMIKNQNEHKGQNHCTKSGTEEQN